MADALPKRAILIVNAMSRKGEAAFEEARDKLTASKLDLIEAHRVTEPDQLEPLVKAAVAKAPMVIIGGGDGSLSSTVDHFVGKELRCPAYLRYVDDFLLFADDKAQLWEWRAALVERLARLRLTIHEESAQPRPVTEGIPFLGFHVFPGRRRLKRRKRSATSGACWRRPADRWRMS